MRASQALALAATLIVAGCQVDNTTGPVSGEKIPPTAAPSGAASAEPLPPSDAESSPPPGLVPATPPSWEMVDTDGEPVPHDRWAHAVDPVDTATAVLAVGCAAPPTLARLRPEHAWEGLLDRDGAPGVALVLTFADPQTAEEFWEAWRTQMRECEDTEEFASDDASWTGRRELDGMPWTESSLRVGHQMSLLALRADLTPSQARELVPLQRGG